MKPIRNVLQLLILPFALCGFAVAQPVYNLLLQTPVFLVARQNTAADIWMLVLVLSLALPLLLALPGWLARYRWPAFASWWCWLLCTVFASLFVAQLLQPYLGTHSLVFIGLSLASGATLGWLLLFSRWSMLANVLALMALLFPVWFLAFSPVLEQVDNFATVPAQRDNPDQPLPNIVFVLLDELPLATLLDGDGQVDKRLFPGFARLQSMSDWYFNTTSVSDGTSAAVPSILTSRYPGEGKYELTVAAHPINLFTILRQSYAFNVAEAVTRFCPQSLCPRTGPGHFSRMKALLLDMTAIYLHRVVPDRWASKLPAVTNNWSGFFAERQVFFPKGWARYAGAQAEVDRPAFFRQFTESINNTDKPTLNFIHILFPHGPVAYFPNGENYGRAWMRGQLNERWGNVEWGLVSGKQRHYLQTQYADHLLNELLDHLQDEGLLDDSMIVVVSDHGISFELDEARRSLSGNNTAAMLRVPLFIKHPGQRQARQIEQPAMTIDILPTLLAALGFSIESLDFDGIDLGSVDGTVVRKRQANSYLSRKLKDLNDAELDISGLVAGNRAQLKLDEPENALWNIGPYDDFRGQGMDSVCEKSPVGIRVHYDDFQQLSNTRPEDALHAYVTGSFIGDTVTKESKPFIITNGGTVVASGYTWLLNDQPNFFALVEPKYVRQKNWQPKAWLLDGKQCLGELK